jgi:hypothetical protein
MKYFNLRITFCDHENNGFVTIGGAGFLTAKERDSQFDKVPRAPNHDDSLVLDKLDKDGWTVLDEKPITIATAEELMSESIDSMIEKGRAKTCFTLGQLKEKYGASNLKELSEKIADATP